MGKPTAIQMDKQHHLILFSLGSSSNETKVQFPAMPQVIGCYFGAGGVYYVYCVYCTGMNER